MYDNLTLITEDLLSERIGQRLLWHVEPRAAFANCLGRRGIGYVKQKLKNFNVAARGMKILVLVDRDSPQNCPIELIAKWIGGDQHPNLVVRFAEMEIESWILADREQLAEFLDVSRSRISDDPDKLLDPKREIVNIARHSRSRRIREDICPGPKSKSIVGPAYNDSLERFIIKKWRANNASNNSASLKRALAAVKKLVLD